MAKGTGRKAQEASSLHKELQAAKKCWSRIVVPGKSTPIGYPIQSANKEHYTDLSAYIYIFKVWREERNGEIDVILFQFEKILTNTDEERVDFWHALLLRKSKRSEKGGKMQRNMYIKNNLRYVETSLFHLEYYLPHVKTERKGVSLNLS